MINEITRKNVAIWVIFVLISFAVSGGVYFLVQKNSKNIIEEYELRISEEKERAEKLEFELAVKKEQERVAALEKQKPKLDLLPPDIERMKRQGCITDGLLNGYSKGTEDATELVNRSSCYYLHRAVETWLKPPDFKDIEETMGKIKKDRKNLVYGMFIAEAIDTKADYFYEAENRELDFGDMCRPGSKNVWGEHTCKPSFKEKEYRLYVLDITKKAIDLGVQSFMFGQVFYQDYINDSHIGEVLKEMRAYAKAREVEIVIGAQTNDIENEEYLRQFDFIEGGVGIDAGGKIEKGPCFSRWWKKEGDWCWALLWNEKFSKKANNVLVHLDWSGVKGDDMGIFAEMSREKRAETLRYLDEYFTKRDVGFLFPMVTPLYKENGGCHGKSRKYYSASNEHSCKDEDVINELLVK